MNKNQSPTKVLTAYIACALWSSTDGKDEPLDARYDIRDISQAQLDKMGAELAAFLQEAAPLIDGDYKGAAHDFWLTRNHHGAGFWDGDWTNGDLLTIKAQKYRELYLYDQHGWIYAE